MPFSTAIKEEALVRSKRCCCLCRKFGGRNVNVHHIIPEAADGPNTLDNAIVLCLTCHAEAGHYNSQHPLGIKYHPSELKRHREDWWEICASGAFIFKDVSRDYILKQHHLVFERWDIDAKSLSRKLRMMGRYDSSYGMKQFVEMVVSSAREFWEAIEKDVTVEVGSGATADLTELFVELFKSDGTFLIEKLTAAYPRRTGSSYLNNELNQGEIILKSLYNKFLLKVFGVCLPE